jgi:serine/threonine-protein kinase
MACMKSISAEEFCPYCGENQTSPQLDPFLPKKYLLDGKYMVGKQIDINGEGISYIGYDIKEKSAVFIREFFSENLCSRDPENQNVKIIDGFQKPFLENREHFLKYFKNIAKLRDLNCFSVIYDIIKENNTCYSISEWVDGINLHDYILEAGDGIAWDDVKIMFLPLISSLSKMHHVKIFHLGICPKNIIVMPNKKIKLVGFATKNLRKINKIIEAKLYDGCSALEQYIDIYDTDESTDVYGAAATIFFAVTGEYPLPALKRKNDNRLLMPKDIVKNLSERSISAIANGLKVYPNNRTLFFDKLKIEMFDSKIEKLKKEEITPEKLKKQRLEKNKFPFTLGIVSCAISLVVLTIGIIVYQFTKNDNIGSTQSSSSQNESSAVNDSLDESQSNEPKKIRVPNLIGKNYKNLKQEIKNKNYGYNLILLSEDFSSTVEEGLIISQTPAHSGQMYENSNVAVNVSKGTKMKTLPDIKGKPISESSKMLTSIKLNPVAVRVFNSEFSEGITIGYKDNNPGDTLEYGSEIAILISKGKE